VLIAVMLTAVVLTALDVDVGVSFEVELTVFVQMR
jgi:hypothetical protein